MTALRIGPVGHGQRDVAVTPFWRARRLQRTASECVECGRALGEHVWIGHVKMPEAYWTARLPFCEVCWRRLLAGYSGYAWNWRRHVTTHPCIACGRLVTAPWHSARRLWVCGELCAERSRRREPEPRGCERCGERFTPARSDARFCSGACRQAAYRDRRRGLADAEREGAALWEAPAR